VATPEAPRTACRDPAVKQSSSALYPSSTWVVSALIRYEFPFNESIRTMLRLEHLFDRLDRLMVRDDALDHHHALVTLFEIMDVAARADLKADLLKDLERQRQRLHVFRGNPSVSQSVLDDVTRLVDASFTSLNQMSGKAGAPLTANEWLMSIRSRISIPGGTCGFDLPAYHAWQQFDPTRRRGDLQRWSASLMPLAQALRLLLSLLRESGSPHEVIAISGLYQQSLPAGRTCQLLMLRLQRSPDMVPEIVGHRLLISVRLMQQDAEGRLKPSADDTPIELTLCL
jgi:cell division protein ZapD